MRVFLNIILALVALGTCSAQILCGGIGGEGCHEPCETDPPCRYGYDFIDGVQCCRNDRAFADCVKYGGVCGSDGDCCAFRRCDGEQCVAGDCSGLKMDCDDDSDCCDAGRVCGAAGVCEKESCVGGDSEPSFCTRSSDCCGTFLCDGAECVDSGTCAAIGAVCGDASPSGLDCCGSAQCNEACIANCETPPDGIPQPPEPGFLCFERDCTIEGEGCLEGSDCCDGLGCDVRDTRKCLQPEEICVPESAPCDVEIVGDRVCCEGTTCDARDASGRECIPNSQGPPTLPNPPPPDVPIGECDLEDQVCAVRGQSCEGCNCCDSVVCRREITEAGGEFFCSTDCGPEHPFRDDRGAGWPSFDRCPLVEEIPGVCDPVNFPFTPCGVLGSSRTLVQEVIEPSFCAQFCEENVADWCKLNTDTGACYGFFKDYLGNDCLADDANAANEMDWLVCFTSSDRETPP